MPSSPTPTNVSCCQPKSFFPSFQLQQHLDQSCSHGPKVELLLGLLPLQFSSVAQSCPTPCDPMNCSTPGLPVHHQCPESTQNHVHRVGDAIQPSCPLSSLFLLPSVFPRIRVFSNESALHIRWPKYWSFSFNISPSNEHQDWSPLEWTSWISLQFKELSRVFSNTTVQKHQFFGTQLSL